MRSHRNARPVPSRLALALCALLAIQQANTLTTAEIDCAIAACAEGYAFPATCQLRHQPYGYQES